MDQRVSRSIVVEAQENEVHKYDRDQRSVALDARGRLKLDSSLFGLND